MWYCSKTMRILQYNYLLPIFDYNTSSKIKDGACREAYTMNE